jgi:hypothetical protein
MDHSFGKRKFTANEILLVSAAKAVSLKKSRPERQCAQDRMRRWNNGQVVISPVRATTA